MKTQAGLWINHRKAIIVTVTNQGEATRIITSDLEQQGAISGTAPISTADLRDRRIKEHLNRYYDQVIACIDQAEAILVRGPGEVMGDFRKRIANAQLDDRIISVELVDRMTVEQLRGAVRQSFPRESQIARGQTP